MTRSSAPGHGHCKQRTPMRQSSSMFALLLVPVAVASCDLSKKKAGGGTSAAAATLLPFTASNIDLSGMDLSKVGDFNVAEPSCTLSSEDLVASCGNGGDALAFKLTKQADGSPIAVYVARSVSIAPRAVLTIQGKNPIAIVALDTIDVRGGLVAAAVGAGPVAGGRANLATQGTGPGSGGAGNASTSAGGGGYCGKGGTGALEVGKTGAPATGGAAHGEASLVPLFGGAAGGAVSPGGGGAGGGAIELVAAKSITIGAGASIHVGGGGGEFGGETLGQGAAGGGSGGSILLESEVVT